MSLHNLTYKEAVKLAKHLRAIGQTNIYLSSDTNDLPWHLATCVEPGSTHRLEIATSVNFEASDSKCGLVFRWSFDIEPVSANGKGSYEVDVHKCREVLNKLPAKVKTSFAKYLYDCAEKVAANAREWQEVVNRQYLTANQLYQASKS